MWKGELRIENVKGCNLVSFEQPASKRPCHCLFRQELLQAKHNFVVSISAMSFIWERTMPNTEIIGCKDGFSYCRRNLEKLAKGRISKNKFLVAGRQKDKKTRQKDRRLKESLIL